jgi:POT family proton-dependent oligopeptide transporter
MPILGGFLADRFLGRHRTVILGGMCMACGHFMMAFESLFLIALMMLIIGIGAFKPNVSTQVGDLYPAGDSRRDRAYSIFYVGINIGALLAPVICGSIATLYGWHAGFAAAGIAMLVSLGIYLRGSRWLAEEPRIEQHPARLGAPLAAAERRRVLALIAVCAFVSLFWAAYDQQGNTIILWAEDYTDRTLDLFGWKMEIPAPWYLSINPLMILLFTPAIVRLWTWQSRRGSEPYSIRKMAYGCLAVALAYVVMALCAAGTSAGTKAGAGWLIGYFCLATIGELYLAPVGLALISKAAPPRVLSMIMGIWFATTLPGDILGGWLGGFWSRIPKMDFFLLMAGVAAFAGAAIFLLSVWLRASLEPKPSD